MRLSIVTASVCLVATGLVLAAEPSGTEPQSSDADTESGLEEITVSAERVGRSLMDTATNVIVLDAAALEQRAIEGTNDLLAQMSNITATGGTNLAPAVRGVDGTGPAHGGSSFIAGTRSRLNLRVDGRPATFNELVYGDGAVWDVQQVEVLRGGRKARCRGRNALAGTLAVRTKNPTYTAEGMLRVMGGFTVRSCCAVPLEQREQTSAIRDK